jgi:aminoglycoside 6'-N-acetyltransferase
MMDDMALPWDFTRLVGARVTLEPMRDDDVDDLYAMQSDPEVCRYLLYEPRTREQVEQVLARDRPRTRLAEPDDYVQPAIRDEHGRFAGTMYLVIKSVDDRTAEIGWILRPEAQGRGYASEAARLLLDFAFEQLELHRVYAELDPRNTASVALCERLGMRHEGHFVEDMFLKGEWTDTGRYAILEREWHARSGGERG